MTILPIHTFDNPILWKEAEYVETFDDELSQLAEDLTETMNNAPSGVASGNIINSCERVIPLR